MQTEEFSSFQHLGGIPNYMPWEIFQKINEKSPKPPRGPRQGPAQKEPPCIPPEMPPIEEPPSSNRPSKPGKYVHFI